MGKKTKTAKNRFSWFHLTYAGHMDYNLLAVVIILISFGLVMLYSASSYEAMTQGKHDMYYMVKQAIIFIISILVALVLSCIDYNVLVKKANWWYFGSIFLMALVLSPLGRNINGARRWIYLGPFSFQPSEVAKIAVILIMAKIIVSLGRNLPRYRSIFYMLVVVAIQSFAAFKLTDNLSTAIIIAGIGACLIFTYHPKFLIFFGMLALGGIILVLLLSYYKSMLDMSNIDDFRSMRILTWFDPEQYLNSGGYQVMQGLYAIGSGGFFGKGLGNSTQKIIRIPEAQNDMIFSIICEELGLFGAILLLVIFGYLLYRLYQISRNAPNVFGSVIASGVMYHFAIQIILNIAVVLNIIPTTGVSLPFVSYGGTSVLFLLVEIGICLNISRQIKD